MRFDISVIQHTTHDTGSIQRILNNAPNYLDGLIDYNGCAHHGGEHSLKLIAPRGDIIQWLEMMIDTPELRTKCFQPDPWLAVCLEHAKRPRHSLVSYSVRKELFKESQRKPEKID